MARYTDVTGHKFNRLTAVKYVGSSKWLFQCECGKEVITSIANVKRGITKSCGCLQKEIATKQVVAYNTKHGRAGTPECRTWSRMLSRCYTPTNPKYKNYGGRGISVCDRWRGKHGFEHFLADMGERPSTNHSLDRIDVNGNYEPSNCRWATIKTQANNKTTNVFVSFQGKTQTLAQWCEDLNLNYGCIVSRHAKGITDPEKLFYPQNIWFREVALFDHNGVLVRTYKTQADAARDLGVSRTYVRLCCIHKAAEPRKYNLEYTDNKVCVGRLGYDTTEDGELICDNKSNVSQ